MHKKLNLPSKQCNYCKRPFSWRKKWKRAWEDVHFCSKRCKASAKKYDQSLNLELSTPYIFDRG